MALDKLASVEPLHPTLIVYELVCAPAWLHVCRTYQIWLKPIQIGLIDINRLRL